MQYHSGQTQADNRIIQPAREFNACCYQAHFHPPSQVRSESGFAPTCPGDQPRAAWPRGPPVTGSCARMEQSCFGGSAMLQGPVLLQRYSAYTKGNSLFSLGKFVGLFHRVRFKSTSLVSAKNSCTQCRKGSFCSIQTGSNGWTGKATLPGSRRIIPTYVSHSSCAGTGWGMLPLQLSQGKGELQQAGTYTTCCKGRCRKGSSGWMEVEQKGGKSPTTEA